MNSEKIKLLVIDDESAVKIFLRHALEPKNFAIEEASTGQSGLEKVTSFAPEVIILDLGLPDMDGFEVLRRLREWSSIPVLVLTVRDSEESKVALLEAGADDYLVKPFGAPELSARLKVALRHAHALEKAAPIFKNTRMEMDYTKRLLKVEGVVVKLTATEYDLLRLLVQGNGRVITQQQLMHEIWGDHSSDSTHYLRIYINHLRKKLERNPSQPTMLITEPGVGYRFDPESK